MPDRYAIVALSRWQVDDIEVGAGWYHSPMDNIRRTSSCALVRSQRERKTRRGGESFCS
jgi:hypothetical protein